MSSCEQFDVSVDRFLGQFTNQTLCECGVDVQSIESTILSSVILPSETDMEVDFNDSFDVLFADECSKLIEFDLKWKDLNILKNKVQQMFLDIEEDELWKVQGPLFSYLISNWEVVEEVVSLVRNTQLNFGFVGVSEECLPKAITSLFTTVNVPMDGSCFYSSLSMLFFGSIDFRLFFRVCAMYTIVIKTDELEHFDRKSTGEPVRDLWFQYNLVKAMGIVNGQTKKKFKDLDNWVDNVMVLATVYAIRRSLFIVRPFDMKADLLAETDLAKVCVEAGGTLIEHIRGSKNLDDKEGLLVFLNGGHYQPLLKRNDAANSINITANRCAI